VEWIKEVASCIAGAGVTSILFNLEAQGVVDPFKDIPEMGRSVLKMGNRIPSFSRGLQAPYKPILKYPPK